ncbi:MAG: hypothetical protein JWN03_5356 [Nocardia sp.]|uniref:hypothetical protein n=1 Tax=Nocardia sp. TaxID=1821 RepID=UPI00261A2A40|nr:hypothetical protein [Nocardia sp.]MCU1645081.1 hypothetical protein [Nocardia sp.]
MPQPLLTQRIGDRVRTSPAPIRLAWNARVRLHSGIEQLITGVQHLHYNFRDTVAWPFLGRRGVSEDRLESARALHHRVFDRLYDSARTAHWYV